ncbi:uncharacterized protein [Rutidosis leptorrhynchoides]|uniref:uncharacterized protein n=1 Tax=Rutidosis leptorrhynchoides TaxID=125765 RepID=UPI003A9A4575
MLKSRELIRDHFVHQIGNGRTTSAWYDVWSNVGCLLSFITHRAIASARLHSSNLVHDIIINGSWRWPTSWAHLYPPIQQITIPTISNLDDAIMWKDVNGSLRKFSVSLVWNTIRPRAPCVPWFRVVWFSQCIPRHAFLLWLLMGEKLKTQDKLQSWERRGPNSGLSYSLCRSQMDNHDHLFFECSYSADLCAKVGQVVHIPNWNSSWKNIRDELIPVANRKVAWFIVAKLAFAASTYFIWQERNNRLFSNKSHTVEQLYEVIYSTALYHFF